MSPDSHLFRLLLRAGLKEDEAQLYLFVLDHPGCSVADVYKEMGLSKSSAYRAFESLRELELLRSDSPTWRTNLQPVSLTGLIQKLENQLRSEKRLISDLKGYDSVRTMDSQFPGIQTFRGDKVFEKYHELAEQDFDTNLVFGSWEDFSYTTDLVSIEKKFIKNRMKHGGKARIFITKDGPNTHEITDYDTEENRTSRVLSEKYRKPTWINTFEGNNLVYIWNLDERKQTYATLVDSKPVADFYKDFIYSQTI
ncbi:hypothetical protein HN748_02580 [Candidatus Peregrinibacteria bacterium]|jgi:hypothetical protein|nr:hypothetical protein [Candidatus Peregrinibacteria bacterium]MBT7483526.1 hypothetical protein [Candidatus Peregrinibacteria bacterium]MBT7703094.1 hypothetical protein [Candidatus Peregrinibacteria bacterium]